jgi:hypothetical protein
VPTTVSTCTMTQSQIDSLKWVPKFAVLDKTSKSMLLYDYEPTNEYIKENFNAIQTSAANQTSSSSSSSTSSFDAHNNNNNPSLERKNLLGNDLVYRLDSSIRKELFISYWRNRISKFELMLADPHEEKLLNYHRKNSLVGFSEDLASRDSGMLINSIK